MKKSYKTLRINDNKLKPSRKEKKKFFEDVMTEEKKKYKSEQAVEFEPQEAVKLDNN